MAINALLRNQSRSPEEDEGDWTDRTMRRWRPNPPNPKGGGDFPDQIKEGMASRDLLEGADPREVINPEAEPTAGGVIRASVRAAEVDDWIVPTASDNKGKGKQAAPAEADDWIVPPAEDAKPAEQPGIMSRVGDALAPVGRAAVKALDTIGNAPGNAIKTLLERQYEDITSGYANKPGYEYGSGLPYRKNVETGDVEWGYSPESARAVIRGLGLDPLKFDMTDPRQRADLAAAAAALGGFSRAPGGLGLSDQMRLPPPGRGGRVEPGFVPPEPLPGGAPASPEPIGPRPRPEGPANAPTPEGAPPAASPLSEAKARIQQGVELAQQHAEEIRTLRERGATPELLAPAIERNRAHLLELQTMAERVRDLEKSSAPTPAGEPTPEPDWYQEYQRSIRSLVPTDYVPPTPEAPAATVEAPVVEAASEPVARPEPSAPPTVETFQDLRTAGYDRNPDHPLAGRIEHLNELAENPDLSPREQREVKRRVREFEQFISVVNELPVEQRAMARSLRPDDVVSGKDKDGRTIVGAVEGFDRNGGIGVIDANGLQHTIKADTLTDVRHVNRTGVPLPAPPADDDKEKPSGQQAEDSGQPAASEQAPPAPTIEAHGGPWSPVLDDNGQPKKNHQGDVLVVNPNGVRAIMDNGVPWTESVTENEKGLVPKNPDDRKRQFRFADEPWADAPAPKPAAKPEKKAEAPEKPASTDSTEKPSGDWKQIGENEEGDPLFANPQGVHSIVKDGVRIVEKVRLRPTKGGMEMSVPPPDQKEMAFRPVAEEKAALTASETAKQEREKEGPRVAPVDEPPDELRGALSGLSGGRTQQTPTGETPPAEESPDELRGQSTTPGMEQVRSGNLKPGDSIMVRGPKPWVVESIKTMPNGQLGIKFEGIEKAQIANPEQPVDRVLAESAPAPIEPEIVTHVTKKGKTLTGTIRRDIGRDEAKALDPYSFRKDGGWFIRSSATQPTAEPAAPKPAATAPAPAPVAEKSPVRQAVDRVESGQMTVPSALRSIANHAANGSATAAEVREALDDLNVKPDASEWQGAMAIFPGARALMGEATPEPSAQTPEEAFAAADAAWRAYQPTFEKATADYRAQRIGDDEYLAVRAEHERLRDAVDAAQDALPDAEELENQRRIKAGIEEVALDEAYRQADDPGLEDQMDDIRDMLKRGWSPGDIAVQEGIDRTPAEIRALEHVWREQGYLPWERPDTGQLPLTDRPIPSSLDVAEQQAKKNQANAPVSAFPDANSDMDPLLANNMDRLRTMYGPDGMMARIVAQWLHEREKMPLGEDRAIKPQSVQSAAEFVYEGKLADNAFSRDRMYDAVESGVNLFIAKQPERFAPTGDLARANEQAAQLAEIKSWLPTQTVRSGDKVKLQQYSTPPDYAFAISWVANIRPGETVIEPSAGTGGIAVHAMNAGAKVVGNEISPQRRTMMETLPFDRITKENAEQLHNILPRDIKPTVVVMNPPFSSAGDRMGGKMVLETGAVHIEQALKRLEPGGRLVAIVGDGMKPEGAETAGKDGRNNATGRAFRDWWKKIGAEYDVRANIGVGGEIYRKYGTTFPTRLLVIDKVAPSGQPPLVTTALTSAELLDALQGVRDARPGSAGEPVADQSGGAPVAQPGQGASGSAGAVRPPTGDVGAGSGQDRPSTPSGPKPTGTRGDQAGGVRPGSGTRPAGGVRSDAPTVQQPKPDAQGGAGQLAVQPATGEVVPGSSPGGDTSHTRPDGSDLAVTPPAPELLETSIVVPEEQTGGELTESVYEDYRPQRITIEGAQPHPGPLVQSAAMASVLPPTVTYKTALPKKLITEGAVSAAQLEAIVYAGNAHSQTLEKDKDGVVKRRGFFIGDGTGVGKGREVAGIILDNKWQGRKKAIWVSEKMPLANDAKRDWAGLGQNPNEILVHNKIKAGDEIKHEGILFTTYDTVKSGEKFGGATPEEWEKHGRHGFFDGAKVTAQHPLTGQTAELTIVGNKPSKDTRTEIEWKVKEKNGKTHNMGQWLLLPQQVGIEKPQGAEPKTRVQQIVDWVGKDFDGVIAFDEAHNMANATSEKGKRGTKEAAAKALAGLELQNALPNARVVYVSATGATEVNNLAYADRLGLWGPGTAFANRSDFLSRVASGGVAAMELVARDMKALGYYTARSLSYDGVEYDRVQHDLTPPQREMYDKIADAWQLVLRNMMEALAETGADGKGGPKSAIMSAFWGGHQRFFNQLITSLQMPSVIEGIDKDLAEGRQAVLQLVNTNEAGQERALDKSKASGDEDLEELDMSPRDQLLQLVDKAFPIWQYETYIDPDGNERVRLVIDSEGNKVANPEAVAAKEKLLLDLGSLRVPDGPLEILVNHYGPEAVAEVTGRKQRVVNKPDETGRMKKVLEKRGTDANVAEANSFQSGKKKILIFSQAGGTGRSYHDDKTAERVDDTGRLAIGGNSGARRSHYLVQAGWRADTAVQGFGRTHRTNQWTAPIFHLVTTDLEGQKRFISSIARRLGQLGALTKGERRTGDQGMFGLQDNLESDEAKAGLRQLFVDIHMGKVEGFSEEDLAEQMGLIISTPDGALRDDLPPMTQFLNRVLSLKVNDQNRVFNEFATRFRDIVDRAAAAGTLDAGTETYKADKITKVSDQVVYTDPNSGAETRHVHLMTSNRNYPTSFTDLMSGQAQRAGWNAPEFFIQNKRSSYISAVTPTTFTKVEPNGLVTEHYRVTTPIDWQFVPKDELDDSMRATGNLNRITNLKEAKTLWDERVAKTPEFKEADLHIITGAILPIWDRLAGQPKIFRLQTDAGERMLGRVVDNKVINETLTRLGAESVKLNIKPAEVVERILEGGVASLANGWIIKRRRVAQEWRLELTGPDLYSHMGELEAAGVFRERIPGTYDTRYFIPTGEGGATTIEAITKRRPIISVEGD